jgi:hypothetical protein
MTPLNYSKFTRPSELTDFVNNSACTVIAITLNPESFYKYTLFYKERE